MMGFTLSIQTDTDEDCPFWFTATDSKALFHYLVECHVWGNDGPDVLGHIIQHVHLNIEPLEKVASQEDYTLAEYLSWAGDDPNERQRAEEAWHRESSLNQAAWQPPVTLRQCLDKFLTVLEHHPHLFNEIGITQPYFTSGNFRRDLQDLQQMTAWAQERDIRHIRLVWA